jgi:hypothetical protein
MKRVFVLGAGASAFAGYPLALDLWQFLQRSEGGDSVAQRARSAVVAMIERVLRVNPPQEDGRVDLEKLLSLLDLAHRGTGAHEFKIEDWPQIKLQIMKMISDAFLWHEYQFQAEIVAGRLRETVCGAEPFGLGLNREQALSTLKNWTELLEPGDTIITFNWDILHESALWRAGKWHFSDGYGFTVRDAPKDTHSPVKILKLHGSVNWAQDSDDDLAPEIEHKATFFRGSAMIKELSANDYGGGMVGDI